MTNNSISVNQELYKGDFLISEKGNCKAVFQDDGNFVVYTWTPIWHTGTTNSSPFRIIMQEDTNLMMYTENDTPVWGSGTHTSNTNSRVRLTLTNDGHLVVRNNAVKIWSSETSQGVKSSQ